MKQKLIKYIGTLLLVFTVASLMPMIGNAAEYGSGEIVVEIDKDLPSNDELFAGYVESLIRAEKQPSNGMLQPMGTTARNALNDGEKAIYDILRAGIKKIANGEVSSTVITITESDFEKYGIQNVYEDTNVSGAKAEFSTKHDLYALYGHL